MLISRRAAYAAVGIWAIAGGSSPVIAQQDFPSKPVRLIVPFAPGGGTDIVARMLAQKLTASFKQSVIVDNRAGGGGQIGIETAVRSVPDGYTTILMSGSYTTNAAVYKMSFDPVQDILPLGLIGNTSFIVAVHPSVQAKTIRDLVALSKGKPGSINYGSQAWAESCICPENWSTFCAGTKDGRPSTRPRVPHSPDLLGGGNDRSSAVLW